MPAKAPINVSEYSFGCSLGSSTLTGLAALGAFLPLG